MKLTTQDFIKKAIIVHNNLYDYFKVDYKNTHEKVVIICKKHSDFLQTPHNHLQGQGCPLCRNEQRSKTRILNTDIFIQKAISIHNNRYDYSKTHYINTHEKVIIMCKIHGDFSQTPHNHLQGQGCNKCGKIAAKKLMVSSNDLFIKTANLIHNNDYDYSKVCYINTHEKIIIVCKIHGDFLQTPHNHLRGQGCNECGKLKSIITRTLKIEEFIKRSQEVHKNIYTYENVNYINTSQKVNITCIKHGGFFQTPHGHMGGQGCLKCHFEKLSYTTLEFINKANLIHNNLYDYSNTIFIGTSYKLIINCKKHGEFIKLAAEHLKGGGCPRCSSFVSPISQKRLNEKNISIDKREKVIYVGKKRYNVDAYNPDTNTIYEFNGDFWHGNPNKFNPDSINPIWNITYGELYHRTLEKQTKLMAAGYNFISIWESDFKKSLSLKETI